MECAKRRAHLALVHCSPIEDLELDGKGAVEFVELWSEGKIKFSDRQLAISNAPDNGFADGRAVGDPEAGVFLFLSDALQWPVMGDRPHH